MKPIIINAVACVPMREAARILKTSYSRVAWLVAQGYLEATTAGGREKFIPVDALETLDAPTVGRQKSTKS